MALPGWRLAGRNNFPCKLPQKTDICTHFELNKHNQPSGKVCWDWSKKGRKLSDMPDIESITNWP